MRKKVFRMAAVVGLEPWGLKMGRCRWWTCRCGCGNAICSSKRLGNRNAVMLIDDDLNTAWSATYVILATADAIDVSPPLLQVVTQPAVLPLLLNLALAHADCLGAEDCFAVLSHTFPCHLRACALVLLQQTKLNTASSRDNRPKCGTNGTDPLCGHTLSGNELDTRPLPTASPQHQLPSSSLALRPPASSNCETS